MIGSALRTAKKPQKLNHKVYRYPAPVGGIDNRKDIGSGDPRNCIYTYNLVPYEFGLRVRSGYREWQIGVTAGANLGVHTLIPFSPAVDDGTGDKLFAANSRRQERTT